MASLRPIPKLEIIKRVRSMERAIKKNCYDCMGGQKKLNCELETCFLYPFRPWAKRTARGDFKKDNEFNSLAKVDKSVLENK